MPKRKFPYINNICNGLAHRPSLWVLAESGVVVTHYMLPISFARISLLLHSLHSNTHARTHSLSYPSTLNLCMDGCIVCMKESCLLTRCNWNIFTLFHGFHCNYLNILNYKKYIKFIYFSCSRDPRLSLSNSWNKWRLLRLPYLHNTWPKNNSWEILIRVTDFVRFVITDTMKDNCSRSYDSNSAIRNSLSSLKKRPMTTCYSLKMLMH